MSRKAVHQIRGYPAVVGPVESLGMWADQCNIWSFGALNAIFSHHELICISVGLDIPDQSREFECDHPYFGNELMPFSTCDWTMEQFCHWLDLNNLVYAKSGEFDHPAIFVKKFVEASFSGSPRVPGKMWGIKLGSQRYLDEVTRLFANVFRNVSDVIGDPLERFGGRGEERRDKV